MGGCSCGDVDCLALKLKIYLNPELSSAWRLNETGNERMKLENEWTNLRLIFWEKEKKGRDVMPRLLINVIKLIWILKKILLNSFVNQITRPSYTSQKINISLIFLANQTSLNYVKSKLLISYDRLRYFFLSPKSFPFLFVSSIKEKYYDGSFFIIMNSLLRRENVSDFVISILVHRKKSNIIKIEGKYI